MDMLSLPDLIVKVGSTLREQASSTCGRVMEPMSIHPAFCMEAVSIRNQHQYQYNFLPKTKPMGPILVQLSGLTEDLFLLLLVALWHSAAR